MSASPGPRGLAPVYARAVLSARRKAAALRAQAAGGGAVVVPPSSVVLPGLAVDADRAAALARATGVPLRPVLPAVGPHLLAFTAQLQLMSADAFPFPLPGLVHVTQHVRQHRPLGVGERAEVRTRARGPLPHAKGTLVELVSQVLVGAETVWEGTSGYLARGAPAGAVVGEPRGLGLPDLSDLPEPPGRTAARWRVPAGAGRAYAGVSGDANPIHLSRLAARALGFRGAIAHGMWTLARAVGQVEPQVAAAADGAVRVSARWGSPLLLGARADLCVEPLAGAPGAGWALAVRSGSPAPGERVHLTAAVGALPRG